MLTPGERSLNAWFKEGRTVGRWYVQVPMAGEGIGKNKKKNDDNKTTFKCYLYIALI